ncbi:MAG: hypothetical protein K5753_01710 [Clostridia bacterium]|nr:hypothetical protein [Clostridia bacterium]
MKKKILIVVLCLLAAALVFGACAKEKKDYASNAFNPTEVKGEIGDFSAVSPKDNAVTLTVPVFSWTAANKAETYTLEIASTDEFDPEDKTYFKKIGITTTSFTIGAALKTKNKTYYWRVTAVNSDHSKPFSDEVQSFYYQANMQEEVPIEIAYADEWTVHEVGSKATVGIDKKDFFGNGKDSLTVKFDEEDTNRGEGFEESDGWIVVTHSHETEFYGVDAFYFNFYYAGNDSEILFRVVDEDNEYWNAPIKLANNAKQTIIIRFDEFTLRTKGGTPIQNQVFDYNYIKSFELVFEKSFGDGIAYFSDLRAINYAKYGDLFISEFDFNDYKDEFTFENYNFGVTVPEDGSSLTYSFSGQPNAQNERGIQGYGFVKMNVNKLLAKGDAFALDLSLTDPQNYKNGKILIRIVEEDGDRWAYSQSASTVPASGKLVVPYTAFTLSEFKGDGFRQFYYIKALQIGLSDVYSGGTVTIANLRVTTLEEEVDDLYKGSVSDTGVIEDFSSYDNSLDLYYVWQTSASNKDEEMQLDSENALGSKNKAGKFGYKTDMGEAVYGVRFETAEGYNGVEIQAKDAPNEGVKTKLTVTVYAETGEAYSYVIDALSSAWNSYKIAFSDMALAEGYFGSAEVLSSDNIIGFSISMQYYFYANILGVQKASPKYLSNNYVFVDNIRFINVESSSVTELSDKIMPSEGNRKLALVSNFDDEEADSLSWDTTSSVSYAAATLTDSTASGEGQALALSYKTKMDAVSYYTNVKIDSSVDANGVSFLLKGDQYSATVYLNLFMSYNGASYQTRVELKNVQEGWATYKIGFDAFTDANGGSFEMKKTYVPYINKISVAVKSFGGNYNVSNVTIDDLYLDGTIETTTNSAVAYGA